MSDIPEKISISTLALYELLKALNGPPHYIREIQVTRNLLGQENCLDIVVREFNQAIGEG